ARRSDHRGTEAHFRWREIRQRGRQCCAERRRAGQGHPRPGRADGGAERLLRAQAGDLDAVAALLPLPSRSADALFATSLHCFAMGEERKRATPTLSLSSPMREAHGGRWQRAYFTRADGGGPNTKAIMSPTLIDTRARATAARAIALIEKHVAVCEQR